MRFLSLNDINPHSAQGQLRSFFSLLIMMAIKLYAVTGGNKDEKCGRPAAKNNPLAPTRSRNITPALYSVSGVNLAAIFLLIQQVASWDPFYFLWWRHCESSNSNGFSSLLNTLLRFNWNEFKNVFLASCGHLLASCRLLNRAGNVKKRKPVLVSVEKSSSFFSFISCGTWYSYYRPGSRDLISVPVIRRHASWKCVQSLSESAGAVHSSRFVSLLRLLAPPPFPCGRLMNGQSIQQIRVVGEKQTDINFERTSLDGSNDTATGQQLSTVWPSWQDAKYTTGSLCSLIEHSKWRCWHRNSFKFRLLLQRLFRSSRQITQQPNRKWHNDNTTHTRTTTGPARLFNSTETATPTPVRCVSVCVCVCVRVLLGVTTFRRKQPSVLDDRWPFTHRVGGDRPISQWQCERHVPHRRGGNNPLDGAVMKFFHWITRGAPHCVSLTTPKFATIPHNIFGKSTRKPARRKKRVATNMFTSWRTFLLRHR